MVSAGPGAPEGMEAAARELDAARGRRSGLLEVLFEAPGWLWQRRVWVLLVLSLVPGIFGAWLPRVIEVTYAAGYVGLAASTFFLAHWYIGLVDVALALLWLRPTSARGRWIQWLAWSGRLPPPPAVDAPDPPEPSRLQLFVGFANRQFAHVDAAIPCVVLAATAAWWAQMPLIVLILGLGPRVCEHIGVWLAGKLERPGAPPGVEWSRRPVYIVAGLLATLGIILRAPGQIRELVRLDVLVAVAALLRLWRWWESGRSAAQAGSEIALERAGQEWGRRYDHLNAVLVAAAMFVQIWSPISAHLRDHDRWHRNVDFYACGILEDPRSRWSREPPPATVSLFIVSDSQFHELRGKRVGGHLSLVDSVVPVAVRPVELDLLSGASLAHFASMYHRLKRDRPDMKWAHLGDFGDLGCKSEVERFTRSYVPYFGEGDLAALAAGNHDSTFTGNFSWHPAWDDACAPDGRLDKVASDKLLFDAMEKAKVPAKLVPHPYMRWTGANKTTLLTVTELGRGVAGGKTTGVVLGVFLDTSDYTGVTLGIAGAQGGVSAEQIKYAKDALNAAIRAAAPARVDVVLFLHHPYGDVSWFGQREITSLVHDTGDRVVAIVSAHTHLAAHRVDEIDGRLVPELVVGSTIDPPQEASLLEIGPLGAGPAPVHLYTLPSVEREGLTCGPASGPSLGYTAAECRAAIGAMRKEKECDPLFTDWALLDPKGERQEHAAEDKTPSDVRDAQELPTQRLLDCVCRGDRCTIRGAPRPCFPDGKVQPLDDPLLHERLDALSLPADGDVAAEKRRLEMVCLAWAASIVQGKKRDDWDLNRALEQSFDGAATFGAMTLPPPPPR